MRPLVIVPVKMLRRARIADAYVFRGVITRAEYVGLMHLETFVEKRGG